MIRVSEKSLSFAGHLEDSEITCAILTATIPHYIWDDAKNIV